MAPAAYHPLPSIVPTSLTTVTWYSVDQSAVATFGPSIRMPDDTAPAPLASPVQPTNAYRTPVAPGTEVRLRLANAIVPLSYQPPPLASPKGRLADERRGQRERSRRGDGVGPRQSVAPRLPFVPGIRRVVRLRRRLQPMGHSVVPPEHRPSGDRHVVDQNGPVPWATADGDLMLLHEASGQSQVRIGNDLVSDGSAVAPGCPVVPRAHGPRANRLGDAYRVARPDGPVVHHRTHFCHAVDCHGKTGGIRRNGDSRDWKSGAPCVVDIEVVAAAIRPYHVNVVVRPRFDSEVVPRTSIGTRSFGRGHANVLGPGLAAVRGVRVEDIPVPGAPVLPRGVHCALPIDRQVHHVLLGVVRVVVDPMVRSPGLAP